MLRREDLKHDVRVKAEKQLEELRDRKSLTDRTEIERKHQVKYRKIKFFEKKKVLRRIEKTRRKIAKTEDQKGKETLRKELKRHKDNLEYIEYFPRDRKYVSLFVNEADNMKQKDEIDELRLLAARIAEKHNRSFQFEDGSTRSISEVQNEEKEEDEEVKEEKKKEKEESNTENGDTKAVDDFFMIEKKEEKKTEIKKRKFDHAEKDAYSNASTTVFSKSKKLKLKKKRRKKKKIKEE